MARFLFGAYILFLVAQLPIYYVTGYHMVKWELYCAAGRKAIRNTNDPQRFDKAEAEFEKALQAALDGQFADARLGVSYYYVGALHWLNFRFDEAEEAYARALRILERDGADSYYAAVVRSRWAEVKMQKGRYPEAEQMMEQALPVLLMHVGPEDSLYLRTRANQALLSFYIGKREQSWEILQAIHSLVKGNEEVGDPSYLNRIDNIYNSLRMQFHPIPPRTRSTRFVRPTR